ncbi:hypothetical protein [Ramlibacter tataouinensis]|uniref:Uncharacterized protein n=1 Tax=Ramlibacter tataouinensis (strain ATCC BAA-407 / DSM 14655 / LMG 21543 / TTB310) TaxID=365046 RepID=F5Y1W9_RAMTT|nr:hypothetical protein [Ramlibacter tataouinensis]AEG93553.1 Hypothetical protein Rta_24550 [Ramlibacter tataouinensis TTB310]
MEQPLFHVVLEGRRIGPYDRRTIVGMRMKKALSSKNLLVDSEGVELTVGELIARRTGAPRFAPQRTGNSSVVQATYVARLVEAQRGAFAVPRFRGKVELRVQGGVLRIAGRFRRGLGWREDRVKLPVDQVAHARLAGSRLELGLGGNEAVPLQRLTLELFTPETATQLLQWFPSAQPFPEPAAQARAPRRAGELRALWVPVAGLALVMVLLLAVLALRRLY